MAQRPKLVYGSDEIPHLWMHQTVPFARNRQGNFYFEHEVIYSYGTHFPIARLKKIKGETVVLLTVRTYSSITAQHCYAVRHAIPKDTKVFEVYNVWQDNVLAQLKHRMKELWLVIQKKRSKAWEINDYVKIHNQADTFRRLMGMAGKIPWPKDYDEQEKLANAFEAKSKERRAKRDEALAIKRAEERRIMSLKFSERLVTWKEGKCSTHTLRAFDCGDSGVFVRLVRRDKFIETSMGVIVPVESAIRLWKIANFCRKKSVVVEDGDRELPRFVIGGFTLNRIESNGDVRIGCHNISWEVMAEMAERLGVKNETHNPCESFEAAKTTA
jgi:hypothetical protein